MITVELREAFVRACHQTAEAGLLSCSSGNMSWRVDKDVMAVTATRTWLERLTDNDIALCRISDGTVLNDRRPSIESRFHAGIFRERPEVTVVLHYQSPCATAVACGRPESVDFNVIIEVPFYIGVPAVVDYLPAGSPELAEAIIGAMRTHDLALLRNHGQVVVGRDFDEAFQRARFFELACFVLLHGKDVRPLSREAVAAIRATVEKKPERGI